MLQGKTVGLVGITSCGSSVLVKQRLLDFFLGRLQLPIGTSADLLDHFMGVIGAYYSANSIAASDTLTAMRRPFVQVSLMVMMMMVTSKGKALDFSQSSYCAVECSQLALSHCHRAMRESSLRTHYDLVVRKDCWCGFYF